MLLQTKFNDLTIIELTLLKKLAKTTIYLHHFDEKYYICKKRDK